MGVGTITEDPLPVVSVAAASATESAAALSFGVSVNQAAAREIRVSYQTSDVTATQDEDYLVTSGVLTFAPGDRRKEIAVPIVGDGFDESDETLLLTLRGVRNATLGANPATGTIRDDDEAPIVSVTDAQGTEGGVLTFEVSLSAASRRGATVGYATVAGAATAGDDYTAAEGTLTFDPDVTTRQVRVALEQDSTHELTETFTVELRSPVNAAVSQTDGSATGAILDDDVRAVVVAPLQIRVREGGERRYTVRLATRPVSAVTDLGDGPDGDRNRLRRRRLGQRESDGCTYGDRGGLQRRAGGFGGDHGGGRRAGRWDDRALGGAGRGRRGRRSDPGPCDCGARR